jgi:hypothetical protein
LNFDQLGSVNADQFTRDGDKQLFALRRLELELGYFKENGKIVIDISYPTLKAYVTKLKGTHHNKIEAFKKIDKVDGLSGEELWNASLEHIIDPNPLPRGLKIRFHDSFLEMVKNYTGEQRIKALITLQILINEGIGNLVDSFFVGKKIKIRKSDAGTGYDPINHRIDFEFGKIEVPFLSRTAGESDLLLRSSSTWLHELSHVYHIMLGLNTDTTNSMQVAYLSDPFLRERLIPLINFGVFNHVLTEITKIDELYDDMITDDLDDFRNNKYYKFLVDNNFLGNSLLKFPANLTSKKDKILARLISFVCIFMDCWTCSEEMLTIVGFVLLRINGIDYLFLDRQNENVYTIRGRNKFRLTHRAKIFLKNSFKTKASVFLSILSQAMDNCGLFAYRPKDQMGRSSAVAAVPIPYETGTEINEDELNRCINNLLDDRARNRDGRRVPNVRTSDKRLYSYISDIVKYAATRNLKLHTDTITRGLNENAFTLSDAMIDQLLENQPTQEYILLQLLTNAQDCDQIKAILDYPRKKGIKLFEYPGFIGFLEARVSEMVNAKWIYDVEERALLLVYAIDNLLDISYLNGNLQPIIKYLAEHHLDHSDCIKSLLEYASKKKLQLEVMSLLDKSVEKGRNDFIYIYQYSLAQEVIDYEAQASFFNKLIEKNADKCWIVANVLEKAKILKIPIDVLGLVSKQITEKKDDGLFMYLNYLNNADYVALEQLLLGEIKNNDPCVTILLSHYVNSKRKLQNENFISDVLNVNLERLDSENESNTRALLDYCLANDLKIKNQEHLPERLQYCIKNKYYSLCAPILKYMGQYKIKIQYKASMKSDQRNPIPPNFVDIFDGSLDAGGFGTDQLMIYAKQVEIPLEVNEIVYKLDGYHINFLIDYADSENIPLDLTSNLTTRIANGDDIGNTLDLVGGLVTFNADKCLNQAIASNNQEALDSIIKYLASIDKIVNINPVRY